VRQFLDKLAEAVANDLLREIEAEQDGESAEALEPQRRAG
jgi:hypothetical protein